MLHSKLASGSAVAVFHIALGLGALALGGCVAGDAGPLGPGAAGATGQAGAPANGSAGTGAGTAGAGPSGAAGTTSGAAGEAPSGTAGTGSSGQAGSGAAGAAAGSAGATGAAGKAGTAGATGTAGASGTAGTTGGGTAGTPGGRPSGPSAGCQAEVPNEPIGKSVQHNMMVTVAAKYQPQYVARKYYTTLPMNYEGTKPYPMVFWGPGCGATSAEGSSFTTGHFLSDVLYVQLLSVTGCFQAGKQGTADSPDGPYFDQVLAEVEARYCVDKGKAFAAGTSSGAWLSNYLGCARGNVLRGVAADSGGLHHDHGTCTGGAAVMEMPGDETNDTVGGFDIGVAPARDLFITLNGCSKTPTTTMTFGKANNCQVYGGCDSPVVWCNVGGSHQSGNQVIAEAAWAFWSSLK